MKSTAWWLAVGLVACTTEPEETGDTGKTEVVETGDTGDTGETPDDPCADPMVTFEPEGGVEQDVTAWFLSGEYLTLGLPGTLRVCPGTWFSRVLIRSDVAVVGLGQRPRDTVLSGGESGTILDITGPDVLVTVDNLTLDRGHSQDPEHNSGGGGLYCAQQGVVFIDGVRFTNNTANDGSALYAQNCELDIEDSTFRDNVSEDDGGAMTLWNSTANLTGVDFLDNQSLDGGAMAFFDGSDVHYTDGVVSGNRASQFSAGAWVSESTIVLTDVSFEDNVNDGRQYGGGLIVHGEATLSGVSFHNNSAPLGGGLFVYYGAEVTGTHCDFSGNTPDDIRAADDSSAGGVSYSADSDYTFSCSNNECTGS